MKKTSIFFLVAVFALALCFSPVQAKTINLKLSYHFGPLGATGSTLTDYSKRITEQSNGRIKIRNFPSATLVGSEEAFEAVTSGMADIAFNAVNVEPDSWPLNQVFMQPALGVPMSGNSIPFYKEAMKSIPELAKEMEEVKVLALWNTGAETIFHTTKKPVQIPNDAAGLKIIGVGTFVNYLKALKINPIGMAPNDFYAALERGVADGLMIPYNPMEAMGVTELLRYHLSLEISAPRFQLIMNKSKWDSLSKKDKELFNNANVWFEQTVTERNNAFKEKVFAKMKKLGHTISVPTEEQVKLWQEGGKPMLETWIQENGGRPARKIYEQLLPIADKYR